MSAEKMRQYAKEYHRIVSWSAEDNAYVVRVAELPGCSTHGDTAAEAMVRSEEAIIAYLEILETSGEDFPVPAGRKPIEAKFVLRMDMPTHQAIKMFAEETGVSMNEYILGRLRNNTTSSHKVDKSLVAARRKSTLKRHKTKLK